MPSRWLKLRGRDLGRDARKSSSRAGVSSPRRLTPCSLAKRTSSRSSASSLSIPAAERPLVREEGVRRRSQCSGSSQCLLAVAEGDLAQRLDGDLGVDLCRGFAERCPT